MKNNNSIIGWVFLLPALLFFMVFLVYPVLKSIQLSFFHATIINSQFVGFRNYIKVLQTERIIKAFLNTFKFMVIVVPIITIIPFIIAVIGYRMKRVLQAWIRFAYYIPILAAGPVISMVWIWIFRPDGILNYLLHLHILWFASNPAAFYAICIVLIISDLGMTIIIYMASMTGLDQNLFDAAKLDGCTEWQEDFYITLPLMKRTAGFIFFIKLIAISQVWMYPFIFTGGGPNYNTNTAVLEIYLQAFQFGHYGVASAIGIIFAFSIGMIGFVQRKVFK